MPLPVAINEEFWESLSPKMQTIVEDSAKEAAQYHRDMIKANEEKQIAELKKQGMEVIKPDIKPFQDKVDGVYESFKKAYGEELVNQVLEAAKQNE